MSYKKGILQDGKTGQAIYSGHIIYGTARFEDGSTTKFTGVQLIELTPLVFGVVYQGQTFTVIPREGCGEIIKANLNKHIR